jgi:hypothetical protein
LICSCVALILCGFNLICFDIVSNPSTHGAFINENTGGQIITPYSRIDSLIYDFLGELK